MKVTLYRTKRLALSIVLVLLLLIPASFGNIPIAYAAGIVVTNTSDDTLPGNGCSLREAIANANNDAATFGDCGSGGGADTITFNLSGTILLTSPLPTIVDSGALVIDATGQSITIDGAGQFGVLSTSLGANLTLTNLTIVNGYLNGTVGPIGAAINNDRAWLTINATTFSSNIVTSIGVTDTLGGAIYNAGTAYLTNVTFNTNQANQTGTGNGYGGAIYNEAAHILNLTNVSFTGNTAKTMGGAIYNAGDLVYGTGTLTGNSAGAGGGLYNTLAPFRLTNVDFLGNSAASAGAGGALQNYGYFVASINNVRFLNNTSVNCSGEPFTEGTGNLRWPLSDTTCLMVSPLPAIMYGNPGLDIRSLVLTPPGAAMSGDPGATITYTLRVTNTGNIMDTYNLSSAPSTWALSYPTSVGPLNSNVGADVPINVTIPPGTMTGVTNTATITLTSQISPTVLASSMLTTTANPLRTFVLNPATAGQSGNPGTMVTYTLQVTNTGNISDTYNISAVPGQWVPFGPATVGPLDPGVSSFITVSISISTTATGQQVDSTTITAASQAIPTRTASSLLTTTANTIRSVMMTPVTATKTGGLGSTVAYSLFVTNTGNLPDTFTFDTGVSSWSALAQPNIKTLGIGAGTNITVSVTIPNGAAVGSSDTVTVTARSQADNTKTALVGLTTSATSVVPGIQTMVFRDPDYVNPVTNAQPGQIVKPAVIMVGGDPASGGTQPSGTVTFMTYGGPGCTGAPTTSLPKSLGTGFALGDATTVANNGLSYQVAYAGDTNYAATTGACVNLSLVKLDTATTLRTSVNPGTAGQAVTLTASVSSTINITPTGTVSFTAGGVTVTKTLTAGTTPYTAVVTHVATFPAGANTISATYNGDNNYNSSSSSGVLNMNMPFFLPFVNKPSPGVNNPSPGY